MTTNTSAYFVLDGAQLVHDVQAVDAAERPEVQQHDLAVQSGERQWLVRQCSASRVHSAQGHALEGSRTTVCRFSMDEGLHWRQGSEMYCIVSLSEK